MKKADFQDLIGRYMAGTASLAEQRLLEAYYERLQGRSDPLPADQEERLRLEMLEEILRSAGIEKSRVVPMGRRWWRYAAAAAVVLLLGGGGYYYLFMPKAGSRVVQVERFKNDVQPGGNRAILTLANGSKLVLDSAGNGQIAQQGGVGVQQLGNGQLAYRVLAAKPTAVLYNTLQTPRGGMYQLRLPDGSRVWLNAESSIRYPVYFTGKEREVELSGEAYFEVIKNVSKPFVVKTANQKVEVLGTGFDINAYPDEVAVKTTVLEGSVRVSGDSTGSAEGDQPVVLRGGEQARLVTGGGLSVDQHPDIDQVMAWKNGLFRFNDASIETIMRNAARWYDVDIVYKTDNKLGFVATISRDVPISKLLKLLELTDRVHFQIDGKKITVLP
jgi:transmembrane sensor